MTRFWRSIPIYIGLSLGFLLPFSSFIKVSGTEITNGIDAILILDSSGSMRTSDRERTSLEAAMLFIDMMETQNSRVGIIEFTNELRTVVPLTSANTYEEREKLKNIIAGFEFGGWTDIGLALKTAAEMKLHEENPAKNPMIILFTDGDIELGPNQNIRTNDMSYQDVWWAVDVMSYQEIPIYTIGLNYHGSVNTNFLQSIAERTMAACYIVDQASQLPMIFSEIFASHTRSSIIEVAEFITKGNVNKEVIIPIHDPFIAEANIIMLSETPLFTVRLTDPNSNEAEFNGVNHILTSANRFSMIKSISPEVGDWTLEVMGLQDDNVTVKLIYISDLYQNEALAAEPESSPEPTPAPTPAAVPTAKPEIYQAIYNEGSANKGFASDIWFLILVIGLPAVFVAFLLLSRKKSRIKIFSGYLKVRARLEDGLYTAFESPDLSTFAGRISLYEFLSVSLKSQPEKILQSIDVSAIYIQPGKLNGELILQLQNNNKSQILDENETIIKAVKSYNWKNNQKLTFIGNGQSKLEITYSYSSMGG